MIRTRRGDADDQARRRDDSVIGAEHSDPEMRPFSLIASTYFDGRSTGMVGVIGPTRMRYSRAIEVVENAAKAMGNVLRDN